MNPELSNPNYRLQTQGLETPVSTTMTPESLSSQPKGLNLTTPSTPSVPNTAGLVASTPTVPTNTPTPAPQIPVVTPTFTDRLTSLFGQSKNKEADLASAIETSTAPYSQQLNEINKQLGLQQAKSIQNQEMAARSGETTGFATREQQNIARTDAIETLKLSSLAEAMQGNIALAEKHATAAVNAKYAEITSQIEDAKTNIYNNYDSFTPAEKKRADQTLLRLDKEDAFVKTKKEDDKITQGFIQEAIAMGAKNGTPVPTLLLQRANEVETPTEALQLLAPYMVDADKKADALLERQLKIEQINKVRAEKEKLEKEGKPVVIDTTGRLVVNTLEAGKVNKEIVNNDAYKALTKAKDSLQFLKDFETDFKDVGSTSAIYSPVANARLKTKYNSAILNLKEFFNLGVLNGPDEKILQGVLPPPTNKSAFNLIATGATKEGIKNMKRQIEQTIDERYKNLTSQYGAYSPQSVSTLNDINRIYVEQKVKLNPEIAKLKEENPSLTDEDIINIIQK